MVAVVDPTANQAEGTGAIVRKYYRWALGVLGGVLLLAGLAYRYSLVGEWYDERNQLAVTIPFKG